jgi:hypothetical protein
MHIWQKRGLRILFSAAFLLALILGSGMSVPAANAGAGFSDNFDDGHLPGLWGFEHNASNAGGGFENNQGFWLSPYTNVWLSATNGWSSLRRFQDLPSVDDGSMSYLCTASIYIKPAVNDSVTFNLEILKPYSYEYIALKQVTLLPGSYKKVSIDWRTSEDDVTVRFSLLSQYGYYKKARLDNYFVNCVYSPL